MPKRKSGQPRLALSTVPGLRGRESERPILELLAPFHSWQLNKISPTTFPRYVVVTTKRHQNMTAAELDALAALVKTRNCYRCRIGKSRYYFGITALEAVQAAVRAELKKRK